MEAAGAKETEAPTGSRGTEPGTVMGTMGYMSPEQVKGLPVDQRSDIFSFGAILYELLSGKKAFRRDTKAETMAAIMRDEPPELTQSGRNISPALDHIVRHCLEKDRERRFQSARDVAFALGGNRRYADVTSGAQLAAPPTGRRKVLIAVAAVVVLAAAGRLPPAPARVGAGARPAASSAWLSCRSRTWELPRTTTSPTGSRTRSRQADLPAGPPGDRPRQLDALQEDDEDAEGDRRGARDVHVPADRDGALAEERRRNRVHVSPELVEIVTSPDAPDFEVAAAVRRGDHGRVSGAVGDRDEGGAGAGRRAWGKRGETTFREAHAEPCRLRRLFEGRAASNSLAATDPPSLRKALGFYEQAVALDPGFAQAWARVSYASSFLYFNGTPAPALAERARQAGEKAVAIAPNRPEGYGALGDLRTASFRGP